jgi:hypothetical protein
MDIGREQAMTVRLTDEQAKIQPVRLLKLAAFRKTEDTLTMTAWPLPASAGTRALLVPLA